MRNSIILSIPAAALVLTAALNPAFTPKAAYAGADSATAGSGECGPSNNYGEAVLGFEGGGDQYATNPGSTATGSYQFLFGTLVDLGYIEPGQAKPPNGAGNWEGVVWTGKGGVYSRDQFMSSTEAQDQALSDFTNKNLSHIKKTYQSGQMVDGIPMTDGGAALASHMLGSGGFQKWAESGFSPSGLDPDIAAAHGWTPEEYQKHLMERVAAGGCYDPANIDSAGSGELQQDLPEIFLMPWEPNYMVPAILPGMLPNAT